MGDRPRRDGLPRPAQDLAAALGQAVAPLLLTPKETARALQISERLLWGLTFARKEIPHVSA